MPETFPYGVRTKYPHMKPRDRVIWEKFVQEFPDMYDTVAYDVPCGDEPSFPVLVDGEKQTSMGKLYRNKIDVVGYKGDQVDVIELKPDATTMALGQVRGYVRDYVKDYAPATKPKAIVITDRLLAGMQAHAAEEEVMLVIV